MVREKSDYMGDARNIKLQQVVSIPISLSKSMQRKYFVGQTETLLVGNGSIAWAGLVNPDDSGVNL